MNEVRIEVWDYLHATTSAMPEAIARALQRTVQEIQEAIEHEWFDVQSDVVAIAVKSNSNDESDKAKGCSEVETRRRLNQMFRVDERDSRR